VTAQVAQVTNCIPLQVILPGMAVALNESPVCLVDDLAVGDYVWCEWFDQQLVVVGHISDGSSLRQLGSTEDLNNFVYTGQWGQVANANTSTTRNYPVAQAGLLEVFRVAPDGHMVHQRYSTYNEANGGVLWRSFYNGTWYEWRQVGGDDSGWVNVTLSDTTNFALYPGYGNIQCRRIGKQVYLRGALQAQNSEAASEPNPIFATLPSGYRPGGGDGAVDGGADLNFVCQGTSANHWSLRIEQAGGLHAERYGPGTPSSGHWLPFNVDFPIA
jgi:hypothetical protein